MNENSSKIGTVTMDVNEMADRGERVVVWMIVDCLDVTENYILG